MISIDITDFEIFSAMRNYLNLLFPGIEVIRTQVNNVPMPMGAFITMNAVARKRVATNHRVWNKADSTQESSMTTDQVIQLDFYGSGSAQRAQTFSTLFYDYHGYDNFPEKIKPLYCTDASQFALISAEENYIERWQVDAHLGIYATVISPQEYMTEAQISLYPPLDIKTDKE